MACAPILRFLLPQRNSGLLVGLLKALLLFGHLFVLVGMLHLAKSALSREEALEFNLSFGLAGFYLVALVAVGLEQVGSLRLTVALHLLFSLICLAVFFSANDDRARGDYRILAVFCGLFTVLTGLFTALQR